MGATIIRDDRVLPYTRGLAIVIVPFLVVAFIILTLFTDRTGDLFAWPIRPSMTAMMLGAAYLGGVYFFARAALARQWHTIKAGFPPVMLFAALLGVATLLHWDRFTHEHIAFVTWAGLYFTTPFLVFGAWWLNRPADPRAPAAGEVQLSATLRRVLGAVGAVTLTIGLLLFIVPQLMIDGWAWTLTPLTARVVGAMFALPGLVGLGLALDARWSTARLILEAQLVSIGFILIAVARAWGDFDQTRIATWLFVGGLIALLIGLSSLYVSMEMRQKRA
jgi:hypothetical protein